jgi:hypothetical protein
MIRRLRRLNRIVEASSGEALGFIRNEMTLLSSQREYPNAGDYCARINPR